VLTGVKESKFETMRREMNAGFGSKPPTKEEEGVNGSEKEPLLRHIDSWIPIYLRF
jgi:hypothetical protein